jgi:SAM-dependent methyltransferase
MYNYIKQLLKKLISKKILFKYEPIFRRIFYQFYKGKNYHCTICNKELRKFIPLADRDKLCPNCGSISRNRRLWKLLDSEFLRTKIEVLDFSPSRCIYRALKKNPFISYTGTDISGDFLSEEKYDITNIDVKNESYDLVICYHVLEHIEDDIQAMKELYRVLKNKGICIIQTPFQEGEIYENPSIKTEDGRLQHFGQKDHVRIYSAKGLEERLSNCGFQVNIREYKEDFNNKYGFKNKETILICTK